MTRYKQGKGASANNQRRRKQGGQQKGIGRNSGMRARLRNERAQGPGR